MTGSIFISYRHGEDQAAAGRLYDRLEQVFEPEQLFRDVDSIPFGEDFVPVLEARVAECNVLLAIIGRNWLNVTDSNNRRRLDNPKDWVRIEIAAALAQGKCVIPVLIDDAAMPNVEELPEDISPLAHRRGLPLSHEFFRTDAERLIRWLQGRLARNETDGQAAKPPQPAVDKWRLSESEHHPARKYQRADDGKHLVERTVYRDVEEPWCPEMVVLPAGAFSMGSADEEEGRCDDEAPRHRVNIAYRVAMGRYPVTFEEYDYFCAMMARKRPEDRGWGRGKRPVIRVSWHDAKDYCDWLTQVTSKLYRLPSEAEWEYACRAGTTTAYACGPAITAKYANFNAGGLGRPSEVDAYPPNLWKLCDMHGNVWEWVEDVWHDSYADAPNDGQAWTGGEGYSSSRARVIRGGCFKNPPVILRSANRLRDLPDDRNDDLGFRVAQTLE